MRTNIIKGTLLLGALTIASLAAAQSAPTSTGTSPVHADIAIMATFEHAQVAQINGNRFWPKGGALDGSVAIWKGIGFAAEVAGERATNIQGNGVNLTKISFMAGPRFSFRIAPAGEGSRHGGPMRAFVQSLYGPTHASDSLFPGPTSLSTSAEALSVLIGGGVDVPVRRGLGVRAIDVAWIHSNYSNHAQDIQNDFRLGFGASYRW